MKKLVIIPLIFILTIYFTIAAPQFYIEQKAIKKDIFISEVAEFEITVNNLLNVQDVLTFSVQDPSWNLLLSQVAIPANGRKIFVLKLDPGSSIPLGVQAVIVKIRSSQSRDFRQELFIINIRPYDPVFGEYRPSIQFGATMDREIDPRKKVPVEIYMRNRNALDVGALELVINGDLFSETIEEVLGPLEEKRTEYLFEIDGSEEPGLHRLDVQLKVKNITINRATQTYEIISYAAITIDSTEKRFLFKNTETITLENLGNAETVKTVNLAMSWVKRMFTSTNPKAVTVRDNGRTSLQWDITIPAQEVADIVVVTNYRIPFFIIIFILILVFLYFKLRSPIVLTKEAIISGDMEEDEGVENLKIRLFVKNRTRTPVEKVLIYDRIPGIAEFVKKKVLGTINPEKVTKQEKKGTMIKWKLDSLEAFEERIITYDIKSKLKIIGNISLPSARATFIHLNKERRAYSQRIIVTN